MFIFGTILFLIGFWPSLTLFLFDFLYGFVSRRSSQVKLLSWLAIHIVASFLTIGWNCDLYLKCEYSFENSRLVIIYVSMFTSFIIGITLYYLGVFLKKLRKV